jgi:FkbH-like protein
VTERLRREQEKEFADKEEFLRSLHLELSIFEDDTSCLPRLSQLTEKTNQFNVDKEPLSEEQIAAVVAAPDEHIFHARLTDAFGDYGVVLFVLVESRGDEWHIRQLLMSCRVFGRSVEDAFFAWLCCRAVQDGAKSITISYSETPKNIPAKEFIDKHFINQTADLAELPESPAWIHLV